MFSSKTSVLIFLDIASKYNVESSLYGNIANLVLFEKPIRLEITLLTSIFVFIKNFLIIESLIF